MYVKTLPLWIFAYFLLAVSTASQILAISSDVIDVTTRIAVCGDLIIENPEDCEGSNLNQKTCQSLGFSSGNLSCDSACEFDYSQCVGSIRSESGSSINNANNNPVGSSVSEVTVVADGLDTSFVQEITSQLAQLIKLPDFMSIFDQNADGTISRGEMPQLINAWIDGWQDWNIRIGSSEGDKLECDLNNDEKCDVVDFSVLMYYIER